MTTKTPKPARKPKPAPPAAPPAVDQEPAEEPQNVGTRCGRCGCRHMRVRKTWHVGRRTLRRRECRHCGKIRTTSEITLKEHPPRPPKV